MNSRSENWQPWPVLSRPGLDGVGTAISLHLSISIPSAHKHFIAEKTVHRSPITAGRNKPHVNLSRWCAGQGSRSAKVRLMSGRCNQHVIPSAKSCGICCISGIGNFASRPVEAEGSWKLRDGDAHDAG